MKSLIKQLLREMLAEADPMVHFNERVNEVLYNIQSIQIPDSVYLPNIPKELQDGWIIKQIQSKVQAKINAIIDKDYPIGGSCVLVSLGLVKIQPLKGNPVNVLITVKRKEGLRSGISYYVTVYDNRLPTLVLADPNNPNNRSVGTQLQAHIKNTIEGGYRYNRDKSFADKSFMDNIIIPIAQFKA